MFIDKVKITANGGKGGDGSSSFDKTQRPGGGDGGAGGNVLMIASEHEYDLSAVRNGDKWQASPGGHGSRNKLTGSRGNDYVVTVPVGTHAYDFEGNKVAAVTEHGVSAVIASGGKGGLGNQHYRGWEHERFQLRRGGSAGETMHLFLTLELISDVIFIGLPNAGKSSMLNALTNANVKTAAYAFTTVEPQMGNAEGIRLLDLPGLIEGTAEGKGLGSNFVRHTKHTSLVAHFVAATEQAVEEYKLVRAELKALDDHLANLPEIVVLSKADDMNEKDIKALVKKLQKFNKNVVVTSVLDEATCAILLETFRTNLL